MGFVILPRTGVVEGDIAWVARDYERLPEALAELPLLAFAMTLLSCVTRLITQSA